jgi:hypothetical protein
VYFDGQVQPGYICVPQALSCGVAKSCTPFMSQPRNGKPCCPGLHPHSSDNVEYCVY